MSVEAVRDGPSRWVRPQFQLPDNAGLLVVEEVVDHNGRADLTEYVADAGKGARSTTMNSVEGTPSRQESVRVYVPNPESELSRRLITGSAIVGLPQSNGTILIHYEGNRFDLPELGLYRKRVERAAMRLLFNSPHGYPTRARDLVQPRDVEPIGTLDVSSGRLDISRPAFELSWWINEADLLDLGLITTTGG